MASLIRVDGLTKRYPARGRQWLTALDEVSFEIERGETLGLVGESGCGKTTLARCLLRLIEPTAGRIHLDGIDLTARSGSDLRPLRRRMQMIFQDPVASLNPRLTVRKALQEPLAVHRVRPPSEITDRILELLTQVGLGADLLDRYPHELSGGQRQRLGIARALSIEPELLVADEPVSALDVSVRAQVINLLADLQAQLSLTYLFIAHDLHLVEHVSDRVAVMYLGRIVELSTRQRIFAGAAHPYTQALLAATPKLGDSPAAERPSIEAGEPPSPIERPAGCHFHPRCPLAEERCQIERPEVREIGPGHRVACHLAVPPLSND